MHLQVIELKGSEFAPGSFSALHQYEMKRRIKPVVDVANQNLPYKVKDDRYVGFHCIEACYRLTEVIRDLQQSQGRPVRLVDCHRLGFGRRAPMAYA